MKKTLLLFFLLPALMACETDDNPDLPTTNRYFKLVEVMQLPDLPLILTAARPTCA